MTCKYLPMAHCMQLQQDIARLIRGKTLSLDCLDRSLFKGAERWWTHHCNPQEFFDALLYEASAIVLVVDLQIPSTIYHCYVDVELEQSDVNLKRWNHIKRFVRVNGKLPFDDMNHLKVKVVDVVVEC